TCRPAVGCLGVGQACGFAGACCSLACVPSAGPGPSRVCGVAPLCGAAGAPCAAATDCCGDRCPGSVCGPVAQCKEAGEACGNADCGSRLCQPTVDGAKRCAPAGGCSAVCELCGSDGECCSGSCVADPSGVGRCAPSAASCGADGEVCASNGQCCSGGTCVED